MALTDFDSVPAAEDFLPKFPTLTDLERALRCPVCGELFRAPVMLTSCGHSFCSTCIRGALAPEVKDLPRGECPICKEKADDSKIRKNPTVEQVIKLWEAARAPLLGMIQQPASVANGSRASVKRKTPPYHGEANASKRRRDDSDDQFESTTANGSNTTGKGKRVQRMATRSSTAQAKAKVMKVEDSSDLEILEERPAPARARGATKEVNSPDVSSRNPLVSCPMCGRQVNFDDVNSHMDSCNGDPNQEDKGSRARQKWNNIFTGAAAGGFTQPSTSKRKSKVSAGRPPPAENDPVERLPKVNYALTKPTKLKEILKGLGLSADGDVDTLKARHARWVTIWNGNTDSTYDRKSFPDLLKELSEWEKTRSKPTKNVKNTGMEKDEMRSLLAQAKQTARKAKAVFTAKPTPHSTAPQNSTVAPISLPQSAALNPNGAGPSDPKPSTTTVTPTSATRIPSPADHLPLASFSGPPQRSSPTARPAPRLEADGRRQDDVVVPDSQEDAQGATTVDVMDIDFTVDDLPSDPVTPKELLQGRQVRIGTIPSKADPREPETTLDLPTEEVAPGSPSSASDGSDLHPVYENTDNAPQDHSSPPSEEGDYFPPPPPLSPPPKPSLQVGRPPSPLNDFEPPRPSQRERLPAFH